MAFLICEMTDDEKTVKTRFSSTERSAFYVRRCTQCDLIHLVVLQDVGGPVTWTVDFSAEFLDQLIPELVRRRAEVPTESGHTAPERWQ